MNEILEKYKQQLLARGLSLNYFYRMRIFLNFLDKKNLQYNSITQENVVQFLNEGKYNEQSKNSFINAGRDFYKFLGQENNEWTKLKLMKTEYKIPDYLSEQEIEKGISYLITYYSKKIYPNKFRALIHFFFYTGARKEEVLNLKRTDFDFEKGSVKLFGKGKKERKSYYPDRVGKEIQECFASEPEVSNAFNISIGKINYYIKKMGKHLNKNVFPHLLRHSGAREMLRKGIQLPEVSKILGHTSLQTTLRYAELNEEERREDYRKKMK
jgi:integrase/recombinase XerD